uniref:Teashirt zinc finger homeobox 3 n=1 Tax=Rhinolophus ferrumequinum TaxID=59479 RepID=A0A671F8J4_RHIFE
MPRRKQQAPRRAAGKSTGWLKALGTQRVEDSLPL